MQHYALFRHPRGERPSGCYPVTRRGAAMTYFFMWWQNKCRRYGRHLSPSWNFERCKYKAKV